MDVHRPRTTRNRLVPGSVQEVAERRRIGDSIRALRQRARHFPLVGGGMHGDLLVRLESGEPARYITRYDQHGRAIERSIAEPCRGVGHPRPKRSQNDTGGAGDAVVRVRGVHGHLLVMATNEADPATDESIEQGRFPCPHIPNATCTPSASSTATTASAACILTPVLLLAGEPRGWQRPVRRPRVCGQCHSGRGLQR